MQVWRTISEVQVEASVFTIGFFDGVHLGHQHLLAQVKSYAQQDHVKPIVVTLWPHPRCVLGKDTCPLELTTDLEYKLELLAKLDLAGTLVLEFTPELSRQTHEEFLHTLVQTLSPTTIVLGYDHHFGYRNLGNFQYLEFAANELHFTAVKGIEYDIDEQPVSSTRIRQKLLEGDITDANRMLGRPFGYYGNVIRGRQLGRQLGVPTANILARSSCQITPARGVYSGYVTIQEHGERRYPAAISVGKNPTVSESDAISVEAHLLDFVGDLYDRSVEIEFIARIREEERFDSIDALKAQMEHDISYCRKTLDH